MMRSRMFASWLCASLSLGTSGTPAWAANSSAGAGGSITITAIDDAGHIIPEANFHPGDRVRLAIHAFDSAGNAVPCTPDWSTSNGFTGDQIDNVAGQADGTSIMTMGRNFGTGEAVLHCRELPGVEAKMVVANTKTAAQMGADHFKTTPPAEPPAAGTPAAGTPGANPIEPSAGAGGGGGSVAGVVLGAGAIVGGGLLLASALKSSSSSSACTKPQTACGNDGNPGSQGCCPSGYTYVCTQPASVKGCYTTIFITGCTLKYFCTTEY